MARQSIARTLSLGLLGVGLVGLAILLGFILLDYHITFGGLEQPGAFARALHEVEAHVLLPAAVITLPMALVGWQIVRRALRPIRSAAEAVAQTSSAQLGVRIDGEEFPAEIAPLADGVNDLLARMEDIAHSNAAFAADVAHELRTPLTLLGLELERLDHPQAGALHGQVRAMQKLVAQLMMIAQLDASERRKEAPRPVDLGAVAANVVAQMAPAALAQGRTLAFDDHGSHEASGQEEALGAALRNLVENALRVTPQGGTVAVLAGPGRVLAVADGGPGLAQAELARLTLRHARADHASRDGAGLGLAIVRRIVEGHGGTLSSDPEKRRIVMEFPALRS